MFAVGDVIAFYSDDAHKRKYHLCISLDGHYLFLNSPKTRAYPGDFPVPSDELPFLPATPQGYSIISVTLVMQKTDAELRSCKAKKVGAISTKMLRLLIEFVRHTPLLTEEERETVLTAAGDWV